MRNISVLIIPIFCAKLHSDFYRVSISNDLQRFELAEIFEGFLPSISLYFREATEGWRMACFHYLHNRV